ncbi:antibiotic biosynthesis monooxygenase [Mumia sp. zg.B21]|uniref:antibiotic biosynthesis monooxygenase n=1 Tax=Mumia sp. zg.B21 TaxID=2855447 RepID=UPI0027E38D87|nr:antibiotic biosynthesis monooxygenase [Mumia sp. zg.B21]
MTAETTVSGAPVTVAITRRIDPSTVDQVVAWVHAGSALAERFEGFLGTGWMRPSVVSDEWHMLYRFADADSLAHWEASPQRRWWLDAGKDIVEDQHAERRTGIEGWFDPPQDYDVEDLRPLPAPPPRWKQATLIWVGFFPLSLLLGTVLHFLWPDLHIVARTLLTTLVATPIMTYAVLPAVTSTFEWWLHGRSPRSRGPLEG